MGVAGWRFANMKTTLPSGRCWLAGRAAVPLPGGGRYRLADHARDHVLQGSAAVRRDSDSSARPQSEPFRGTAIVVEDDVIQRNMIALLLEERNFTVIPCEDAETAFWLSTLIIHLC